MEAAWIDDTALRIIDRLTRFPDTSAFTKNDLETVLREAKTREEFDVALTAVRLFLDLSDDQFSVALANELGQGGSGIKRFKADKDEFLSALDRLGAIAAISQTMNTPVMWIDLLK